MILFDNPVYRNQLKPLTLTRPVAELRIGILKISEKWQQISGEEIVGYLTESYLTGKFGVKNTTDLYVNGSVLPTAALWEEIRSLESGEGLFKGDDLLAAKSAQTLAFGFDEAVFNRKESTSEVICLKKLPDLFLNNAEAIKQDFERLTHGRISHPIEDPYTRVYAPENVFVEEGASIKAAIINAENGPVYIGKKAVLQEGCLVIGPVAIGEESMVAFGAKIRPNVTLGPVSRVGGEVGNSIFMGYSNKAHDGFLGNSVIGEWCNLGANTNNSNLKNDYQEVKLYDYHTAELTPSGELFCGTFMGDYTKAGISTMFNTGTVLGVCCNVFGAGFQEKFVPSFTWGGKVEGYVPYRYEKAIAVINATMARRNKQLSADELAILDWINTHKSPEI